MLDDRVYWAKTLRAGREAGCAATPVRNCCYDGGAGDSHMSFYDKHILPRIIDLACGIPVLTPARQKVVHQATGTVLEIGFGSGLNLPLLPAAVTRVLAVDPSETAQKLGRKRIEAARCPIDFIGLDAVRIKAETHSADSALSTFTLCTIDDVAAALREVRRILKPGGKFLFVEHGRSPDAGTLRWQDRLNPLQQTLCGGCNLNRDIAGLVRDAGFELRELEQGYAKDVPRTHGYLYSGVAV
jgi:SAM-dependent methyltransferase